MPQNIIIPILAVLFINKTYMHNTMRELYLVNPSYNAFHHTKLRQSVTD